MWNNDSKKIDLKQVINNEIIGKFFYYNQNGFQFLFDFYNNDNSEVNKKIIIMIMRFIPKEIEYFKKNIIQNVEYLSHECIWKNLILFLSNILFLLKNVEDYKLVKFENTFFLKDDFIKFLEIIFNDNTNKLTENDISELKKSELNDTDIFEFIRAISVVHMFNTDYPPRILKKRNKKIFEKIENKFNLILLNSLSFDYSMINSESNFSLQITILNIENEKLNIYGYRNKLSSLSYNPWKTGDDSTFNFLVNMNYFLEFIDKYIWKNFNKIIDFFISDLKKILCELDDNYPKLIEIKKYLNNDLININMEKLLDCAIDFSNESFFEHANYLNNYNILLIKQYFLYFKKNKEKEDFFIKNIELIEEYFSYLIKEIKNKLIDFKFDDISTNFYIIGKNCFNFEHNFWLNVFPFIVSYPNEYFKTKDNKILFFKKYNVFKEIYNILKLLKSSEFEKSNICIEGIIKIDLSNYLDEQILYSKLNNLNEEEFQEEVIKIFLINEIYNYWIYKNSK